MQKILLPKGDFIFFPSGDANVPSQVPNIPTSTDSVEVSHTLAGISTPNVGTPDRRNDSPESLRDPS